MFIQQQYEKNRLRIFKYISIQNSSYGYPEITEAGFLSRGIIALAKRSLNSEQLYQVILIYRLRFLLLFTNVMHTPGSSKKKKKNSTPNSPKILKN